MPRTGRGSRRVGLSISDSTIHAVEVSGRGRSSVVTASAAAAVPPGAVVHGSVRDADTFAGVLGQMWAEAGFRTRNVIVGLGPNEAFVRAVELPKVARKLRAGALGFELADMLPFPQSEAMIDYRQISSTPGDEDHDRFLVVAAHAPSLQPVMDSMRRAGLHLKALDVPAFAAVRAARALSQSDEDSVADATAVVAMGAELLTVTIHEHGAVRFTRQVPVASGAGSKLSGVLESELSSINAHLGSHLGGTRPGGSDPIVDAVYTTIEFEGQVGQTVPVGCIEVVGGGPVATALFQGLEQESREPVEHITAWPGPADRQPVDADWVAMGHAIEGNLSLGPPWPRILPDATSDRRRRKVLTGVGSALAGAAAAILIVVVAGPPVSERSGELDALEARSAQVSTELEELGAAVEESSELNTNLGAAGEIRSGSIDWDAVLAEIRTGQTPGSRLLSFEGLSAGELEGEAAGLQVTVESGEPTAVEDWLAMLSAMEDLGDPVLESITSTAIDSIDVGTAPNLFIIRATVGPVVEVDDLGEEVVDEDAEDLGGTDPEGLDDEEGGS